MAQADTENGQLAGGLAHNVEQAACLAGAPRARREHKTRSRYGEQFRGRNPVTPDYLRFRAERPKSLVQVENKRIAIVEQQKHPAARR